MDQRSFPAQAFTTATPQQLLEGVGSAKQSCRKTHESLQVGCCNVFMANSLRVLRQPPMQRVLGQVRILNLQPCNHHTITNYSSNRRALK